MDDRARPVLVHGELGLRYDLRRANHTPLVGGSILAGVFAGIFVLLGVSVVLGPFPDPSGQLSGTANVLPVVVTCLVCTGIFVSLAIWTLVFRSGLSLTVTERGLSLERWGHEVHRYPWSGAVPPIQIRDPRVPQSESTSDSVVPHRTPPDAAWLQLGSSPSSWVRITDAAYDAIVQRVADTGGRMERSIDVVRHRKSRSYHLLLTIE
jgi:hypothetical protein